MTNPNTPRYTSSAALRKAEWAAMPDECFTTLTFGELAVGDQFIFLPTPGDNHGHGGFIGTHFIFKKTEESVLTSLGEPYGIPTGRAVNVHRGIPSDFPHAMSVLRVL